MSEHSAENDVPGCPSATDFRADDGVTLLTRCRREAGHPGRHSDKQTKKWDDTQTTWHVIPPAKTDGGAA